MSGIERIAAERQRQIDREGYYASHDDEHVRGDLAWAARCYLTLARWQADPDDTEPESIARASALNWPWAAGSWKPSDDPIRNLEKSGALIAAEIDRLERARAEGEARGDA